ncbi:hypothetical protein A374_18950 [Fictibacillus macauensis ZFHKF-1]|uniref:Uncharacterized protein n=1 Tax=Fictibacillus macauensis ZFHKF-1 TaxID=1196324 RepID=I8AEI3_9BACL|nr:DUF5082 family protein [Fictibacillus macauensis]EIT83744.1 hypothetical protein A374_18950 [Fictibacillus macauensis ZFHKF-1]
MEVERQELIATTSRNERDIADLKTCKLKLEQYKKQLTKKDTVIEKLVASNSDWRGAREGKHDGTRKEIEKLYSSMKTYVDTEIENVKSQITRLEDLNASLKETILKTK